MKTKITELNRVYLFSFFWMFLVLVPVAVPYFQSLGLSMEQFFQLQALYGICFVFFEIPTGYICDLWGRKSVLLMGSFISAAAYTALSSLKTFPSLAVYEIFLAAGASLVSGADLSFLYDELEELGQHRSHGGHALANFQLVRVVGESVAALLSGFLVVYSFRHVLWVQALVSWMPFFIAMTLTESRKFTAKPTSHLTNIAGVFRQVFREQTMLRLISLNLTIWSLASFFAVWLYQKYWQEQSIPLSLFGYLWATFNLTTGMIGKWALRLKSRRQGVAIAFTCILSLSAIGGYFGMAGFAGWLGASCGALLYVSRGVTNVFLRDEFNQRISSDFRATANSLQSLMFRFGFGVFGPAIGYGVDHLGMTNTLLVLGCSFVVLFVVMTGPLIIGFAQHPDA